jgi:hypothetical protein
MIYAFDANSLSELNAYYPDIFKAFWTRFDAMAASGDVVSTREVRPEVERSGKDNIIAWIKAHSQIFTMPGTQETAFVAEIFAFPHFQALIGQKALLRGTPVADPFLIACAKVRAGTVVTQEKLKPNAAKIPNVCAHFGIPCVDLERFMREQNWSF